MGTNNTGNKALTYPIGTITIDELLLSGCVNGYMNKLNYTYSSSAYWTFSPRGFYTSSKSAYNFYLTSAGYAGYYHVVGNLGVRPVINISSEARISGGVGTANSPFEIKTT